MLSYQDKVGAFYKDNARANSSKLSLVTEEQGGRRPPYLLFVLLILLIGILALLAITGVRFHQVSTSNMEFSRLLKEDMEKSEAVHHQVIDVLTPLFKIIGDEIGLRLPQKLNEIKQFILQKTNFFNPNREFDFRDLHWCINPPSKIKVNFTNYCDTVGVKKSIASAANPIILSALSGARGDIFPPYRCSGATTSVGRVFPLSVSLSMSLISRTSEIINMLTAISDGVYGKTYLLVPDYIEGEFDSQKIRVFEIGFIKRWLSDMPLLQTTNYMVLPETSKAKVCTIAVGELTLASLCVDESTVLLYHDSNGSQDGILVVTLGIFGATPMDQVEEVIPIAHPSVERIHITNHRGFIKDSIVTWMVPVLVSEKQEEQKNCLESACHRKSYPMCNQTSWEPFGGGQLPSYGRLTLPLDPSIDLQLNISFTYGPVILNGDGMDYYESPLLDSGWLTIPPKNGTVLGLINKASRGDQFTVTPHVLTFAPRESSGNCYLPIQTSQIMDKDVLTESNLVVLPTQNFRYVIATYDISRGDHAIVYYVYDPIRTISYTYPFRLTTKGRPDFLRIECFVWDDDLWCHQFYRFEANITNSTTSVENLVRMRFSCNRSKP
uniref:Hemagglutinin glycoprotein n=1 Tax=Morbillivirus canis TaxID=3052342 RepID=A0A344TA53_9MONO|nr:hemagglutinin protein [Morbillivirus canis]